MDRYRPWGSAGARRRAWSKSCSRVLRYGKAFEIVDRVDFLAVETTHLHAHIAAGNGEDSVLLQQRADELQSAAVIHPGLLLARIESEGEPGIERDRGIFADIERGERVAALDCAALRRIPDLQRRHDF